MSSHAEITTFVQSIMTTLQPLCVEHYRELTKHARRKKARGGPPPTASVHFGAGSQSLSKSGWNARYEIKQGVFAEFRQEMDVAERHYGAAIDELFSSEGVFEATASWSPRWEEARLLCDALAIRTLRCQLWVSQTTGAVQSWINYKDRMRDLIDRRGKGSQTYGWAAWESRWAEVMAQLVSRADLTVQRAPDGRVDDDGEQAPMEFHMAPEKSFAAADRLRPFQMLHHSGYWLRLAIEGARERRSRAMAIPDEDRTPPGQSPASAVANRVRSYDLYLASDPHKEANHDHVQDITRLTELSTEQFEVKGQGRIMETLKFDLAKDLIEAGKHQAAKDVLLPLWESSSWRQEEWRELFGELLSLLNKCAASKDVQDPALLVATTYELQSSTLTSGQRSHLLENCLNDAERSPADLVRLRFRDNERISPVLFQFAFETAESHVGETLECQLTISSRVRQSSRLDLSSVTLHFGSSRTVKISAAVREAISKADAEQSLVVLKNVIENGGSLEGEANLQFESSQRKTITFHLALREAGALQLTEASFLIRNDNFEIEHSFSDDAITSASSMLVQTKGQLEQRHLPRPETIAINVLPKPPKVKLLLHGLHKKHYTDERISMAVEVINEEAEAVNGKISADARSDDRATVGLSWTGPVSENESTSAVVDTDLPTLQAGSLRKLDLQMHAPSHPTATNLAIDVEYTLASDKTAPLRKTLQLDLSFVKPFEAQYNFGPVLYPGKWPSFFDPDNGSSEDSPGGIPQLWRLSSQVRSLAADTLVIHALEIVKEHINGDSKCTVRHADRDEEHRLRPGDSAEDAFHLRTQKCSLDDRRPTTLESSLLVTWSRENNSATFTTSLPVPRLTLPVSEPRVLCTLSEDCPPDADATLHYHIENPSTHFLTFALTMEASEDFAFSGPKYRTLSLAPLSRHRVEFDITLYHDAVPEKESGRWVWPSLQVMDSYYQKNLKVHPAGPDVKMDEKGPIGVWLEL